MLAYAGLRLSEALGLTWDEVDFENGELRVPYQLSRATREKPARRVSLKTDAGRRDVILRHGSRRSFVRTARRC